MLVAGYYGPEPRGIPGDAPCGLVRRADATSPPPKKTALQAPFFSHRRMVCLDQLDQLLPESVRESGSLQGA